MTVRDESNEVAQEFRESVCWTVGARGAGGGAGCSLKRLKTFASGTGWRPCAAQLRSLVWQSGGRGSRRPVVSTVGARERDGGQRCRGGLLPHVRELEFH